MIDEEVKHFRLCFNNDSGHKVLGQLLGEAGFGRALHTPEDIGKENLVKLIIRKCGITEDVIINDLPKKLFELPIKIIKE